MFTCKIEKPINDFSKDLSKKDGLHTYCRECAKSYRLRFKINNPQKSKEYSKKYRKSHPDKIKEDTKRYAKENKEKVNRFARNYYRRNKDIVSKRAKERNKKLFEEILNHYGNNCSICKSIVKLRVDHIGGRSEGKYKSGSRLWVWLKKNNYPEGFRILCHSCNIVDGFLRKHKPLGISGIDDLLKLVNKVNYEK